MGNSTSVAVSTLPLPPLIPLPQNTETYRDKNEAKDEARESRLSRSNTVKNVRRWVLRALLSFFCVFLQPTNARLLLNSS